jgi:meiotically up-regulated gene 157 (Mug157) protein
MPYLGRVSVSDPIYQNTGRFVLSSENVGGPHIGKDMIWPMAIIARGLTSQDDKEIAECIKMLQSTHGDTGFMHESFHKDNPKNFTRSWFAWTNTIFGEFLWKTYKLKPQLLG